jgi:hypothetical protein
MIIFGNMGDKPNESTSIQKSWLTYNKESSIQSLAAVDWQIESDTVQDNWNQFSTQVD